MSDKAKLQIENALAGIIIGLIIGVAIYYAMEIWGMLV